MKKLVSFTANYFIALLYILIISSLFVLFEFIIISRTVNCNLTLELFLSRINFEAILIFGIGILFYVPFYLINTWLSCAIILSFKIVAILFLTIQIILIQYFIITNTPLGSEIKYFSITEIFQIVGGEMTLSRLYLWIVTIVFVATTYLGIKFGIKKVVLKNKLLSYILFIILLIAFIAVYINKKHFFRNKEYYKSRIEYCVGNSKLTYFIVELNKRYEQDKNFSEENKDIINSIPEFCKLFPEKSFVINEYPLVQKNNYANVLGNFFKKDIKNAPNIVFLIVESLSREVSGPDAPFAHLTPFLDSLAEKSLFFDNFLSNQNRTFGVLPSILASSPSGPNERGFINVNKYPDHISIIELLKSNGYITSFFHGGWINFDLMGNYLNFHKIDNIFDDDAVNKNKYGLRHKGSWGYNDLITFNNSFDKIDSISNVTSAPRLDIYLTLDMHSPLSLKDNEYQKILNKLKKINNNEQIRNIQSIDKDVVSTIVKGDESIQFFFKEWKKRKEYENTIFIITGDHLMWALPSENDISFFQVPLIIYSPLLIKNKRITSISSHIDIVPTLTALLQSNYNLIFPSNAHWLGSGIDTSNIFASNKFVLLSRLAYNPQLLIGDYFINGQNKVFKINNSFKLNELSNYQDIEKYLNYYKSYININNYVCSNNKLWNNILYNH